MKTIAIDFDGVIHKYSKGWADGSIYDEPIKGSFEAIKQLMNDGYAVFIFSTRTSKQIVEWIQSYTGELHDEPLTYLFKTKAIPGNMQFWNETGVLGVTDRKLPAIAYIDDRAVKFTGDWSKTLEELSTPTQPGKGEE